MTSAEPPAKLLLIGPGLPGAGVGGLQIALRELAAELRARGWDVETALFAGAAGPGLRSGVGHSQLAALVRSPALLSLRDWLPTRLRRVLSSLAVSRTLLANLNHNLRVFDALLDNAGAYSAILVCVEGLVPGMAALAVDRHPCVALVSLPSLGEELGLRWLWPLRRRLAAALLGGALHPAFARPVEPARVQLAIFANQQWRDDALRAGLPPHATRVIYFGVPDAELLPRPLTVTGRLLWLGRLGPEKGLHLLIDALPAIRAAVGPVTLTAIAGQGHPVYRHLVEARIRKLGLEHVVELRPPVERHTLGRAYAEHDLLCFVSENDDPVALTLMEAFAAGLPVVASLARPGARLVRAGETCRCFEPRRRATLVAAVASALREPTQTATIAARARELVSSELTLAATGAAFDAELRALIERAYSSRPISKVAL